MKKQTVSAPKMNGNGHQFQVNVDNDFLVSGVSIVSFGNSFYENFYEFDEKF
jgi:hypothetical protein